MARDPLLDQIADLVGEIADRARRTETRITKVANHLGVDAGGEKPELDKERGVLQVPSRKTSLDDVVAACAGNPIGSRIEVYCGGNYLMTLCT